MSELVSVIVPIYGVEEYLPRCVKSLLAQSHRDLDIILIDDGSPDHCGALCDAYAAEDSRVRVIHQENTGPGPSGARNAGLAIARGRFLMFVDPDDWVHEEIVSHLLALLEDTGADIAACGFERMRAGHRDPAAPDDRSSRVLGTRDALELYAGPFASGMTAPWGKLFRAPLIDGLCFPPGRLYEDEFFTYKVVARAKTIVLSQARLYYYFVRNDSTTQRSQSARQLLDRAAALQERGRYFREIELDHASAISFKKAFLLQRSVRRTVLRSGDVDAIEELRRNTEEAIRALRQTSLPVPFRAAATLYAVVPGLLDVGHSALQGLKSLTMWVERTGGSASSGRLSGRTEDDRREPVGSELERGLEIVVVAYGTPGLLRRALEPVSSLPITVVDNSSLPEIKTLCEELGCRYIDPLRNDGFAAGVNVGLLNRQIAGGEVLLLNPDAAISTEGIQRLHKALLAEDDLASVGPRQVDKSGRPIRVSWPFPSPVGTWLDAVGLARLRPRTQYVSGAILLLRAEALDEVGQFDERFFLYAEEADWAYRARRAGWRHVVVDSVTALHEGGGASTDEARRLAHFHGSQERFLRKHHGVLGWQVARCGQILGDTLRSLVRRGPTRDALRLRAALYLRGPAHVEAANAGDRQGRRYE